MDELVPSGIASAEAFGTAEVTPGSVTITVSGIASAETFGVPVFVPIKSKGYFISIYLD